jgi:hypothetical protein
MHSTPKIFAIAILAASLTACHKPNDTFNFPILSDEQFKCYYGKDGDEHGEHGEHHEEHGEEAKTGAFGEKITADGAITPEEFVAMMATKDSAEVKMTAKIHECCKKKGCWMDVELTEGKMMTVRFKDYGFFVPKNADGQTAIIQGMARKEVESVEWLKEKAKDAGKTKEEIAAIKEPVTNLTFEAVGVIIK